MKKLLALVILMLMLVSATNFSKTDSALETPPSIEGTWELVSFYNYIDGEISDTLATSEGYRQIKMFYNGKVMWTRYVPSDSVEWFGYGSYTIEDNTLTEKLEYMSASMQKVANTDMEWNMELELKKNSFSQIFLDDEGNRINSENYKRID
ncbi:hypothetical protein [Costertonia aggregata]|uniref:Lipocalin family protein n=1 Tax=Costertonia aggregata TaxID=343403 RepID=A0A7H9AKR1_9FLAO|nr:hypothetical protein [Costertonia aggregata]QLG44040.1 hypothetical protein HYG79_01295 [Costertonia aggregata]